GIRRGVAPFQPGSGCLRIPDRPDKAAGTRSKATLSIKSGGLSLKRSALAGPENRSPGGCCPATKRARPGGGDEPYQEPRLYTAERGARRPELRVGLASRCGQKRQTSPSRD